MNCNSMNRRNKLATWPFLRMSHEWRRGGAGHRNISPRLPTIEKSRSMLPTLVIPTECFRPGEWCGYPDGRPCEVTRRVGQVGGLSDIGSIVTCVERSFGQSDCVHLPTQTSTNTAGRFCGRKVALRWSIKLSSRIERVSIENLLILLATRAAGAGSCDNFDRRSVGA